MDDPLNKLTGPIDNIRFFWVVSFFIISLIVIFNLKPKLQEEWNVKYQFTNDFTRSIMPSLAKMYASIDGGNIEKILTVIREEMCINAAIMHDTSPSYFFKYRNQPEIMSNYFNDDELLLFLLDPKLWVLKSLVMNKSVLRLSIEDAKAREILNNFHRLLQLYRDNLYFSKTDSLVS